MGKPDISLHCTITTMDNKPVTDEKGFYVHVWMEPPRVFISSELYERQAVVPPKEAIEHWGKRDQAALITPEDITIHNVLTGILKIDRRIGDFVRLTDLASNSTPWASANSRGTCTAAPPTLF